MWSVSHVSDALCVSCAAGGDAVLVLCVWCSEGLIMVPRSRNASTTQTLPRSREPLWFCVGLE